MEKRITVGLIQQSNTPDREEKYAPAQSRHRTCAEQGAQLVVLQELHNSLCFCQTENTECLTLKPFREPSTDFYSKIARQSGIVLVTSLFERRAPGLYHQYGRRLRQGRIHRREIPQNAHFPTTLPTTKSSTLHRAIWDSSP